MERIYGVHLGTEKVCVCLYEAGRVEVVCETPACCAFTEMGEVLAGQRAVNARRFHPEREPVAVVPALDEDDWMEGTQILWRGMKFGGEEALACLMKEVRRQMPGVRETEEIPCVVATSAVGYFVQPFIERSFAAAGFAVRRVLRTAVACAVEGYWREMRGALKGEAVAYSCAVREWNYRQAVFGDIDDEVMEVYCFENCTDTAVPQDVLERGYEARRRDIADLYSSKREEWHYYYDKISGKHSGIEIKDIARSSAAGAAWHGEVLTKSGVLNLLILDCMEYTICVEVTNENGDKLMPLKTAILQSTTIPTHNVIVYDRSNVTEGSGREILTVYAQELYKPMYKIGEFALEKHLPQLPDSLELVLDMDTNAKLGLTLCDTENSGNAVKLPLGKKTVVPSTMSVFAGVCAESVFDILEQSERKLYGYGRKCFTPAQEKGLRQIAIQCYDFIVKWERKKEEEDSLWDDAYRLKAGVSVARQKEMLEEFIWIVDNLGYALRQGVKPEAGAFRMFVLEEYRGLLEMAETRLGLVAVAAEGAVFDPKVHSATEYEHAEGVEESIVIEERLKGYLWNGTLLRPAMVKVVG